MFFKTDNNFKIVFFYLRLLAMRNTIIISVLIFIAVVVVSIFYFSDVNKEFKDTAKPLQYLPADTYMIASFRNEQTTDRILADFEPFEALLGKAAYGKLLQTKTDLLRAKGLRAHIAQENIYVSLHQDKKDLALVWTIPFHEKIKAKEFLQLLQEVHPAYKVSQEDTLKQTVFLLENQKNPLKVYLSYEDNIVFASYAKDVLLKVLDKNAFKLSNKQIEFFLKNQNANTPLSLYFTNKQISVFTKQLLSRRPSLYLSQFDSLQGETFWNMNYKSDALIFSGESNLVASDGNYIGLFTQQKPVVQKLADYFPANTASYMEYSLSDKLAFAKALDRFFTYKKEINQLESQRKNIEKNTGLNSFDLNSLWDNNFALVELTNQEFLAFSKINTKQKESILEKIASLGADSIYQFDYSGIVYQSFGQPFKNFHRPYFIQIDDILVIGQNKSILQQYKKEWEAKRLLVATVAFKKQQELQGQQANITCYVDLKNAQSIIRQALQTDYAKIFQDQENYAYQSFNSWSIQLNGHDGNFVSNMYAFYKSKSAPGSTAEWTYAFDGRLTNHPWLLNYADTSKFILAQEQNHTVHAILPTGQKLWSSLFQGEILGDPIQLKDQSILLNSNSRLYRMDTNGKTTTGFSVQLSQIATAGISLVSSGSEQKIFIPAKNGIMAYDLNGVADPQWSNLKIEGNIIGRLRVVAANKQYYIIAGTDRGEILFFSPSARLAKIEKTSNTTNPIELIDVPDAQGSKQLQIISVAADGLVDIIPLQGPRKQHKLPFKEQPLWVEVKNVTADQTADIVVFYKTNVEVYASLDTTLYYSYSFAQDLQHKPEFFPSEGTPFILAFATSNTLIYALQEHGVLRDDFPLEGLARFYYGPIQVGQKAPYLLSTKRDHRLYAYRLKP